MAQAGFARGGDGFYTSPGEGRLSIQLKTNAASDNESRSLGRCCEGRSQGYVLRVGQAPRVEPGLAGQR